MRFEFDRTTLILLLFVVVIAALFGINQFILKQEPLLITVVTDPIAETWLNAAVAEYNNSNAIVNGTVRVQVQVQIMDDLDIWRGNPNWNSQNHPAAWLASSSLSLSYIPPSLPFELSQISVARSPLVWGGFSNRVELLTETATLPFDWNSAQTAAAAVRWSALGATNDPANVNMAINWPTGSMSGLGALMSAAATYGATGSIDRDLLTNADFLSWWQPLEDAAFNSQRLGANPAATMASRGASAADFGLLPEVLWLQSVSELGRSNFVFAYPSYQFVLDFPYAVWDDAQTDANSKAAAESFGAFLAGERGQALALQAGFRPANAEPTETASRFTAAQAYGIELVPTYGIPIDAPSRSLIDALLNLVN